MKSIKTVQCKLQPTKEQWLVLKETLQSFADACNFILQVSQQEKTTNRFKLQKFTYRSVREKFPLSANLTVRAIARVSQATKRRPRKVRFFRATSADYDERIFSYNSYKEQVSLSTVRGRLKIPLGIGNYQRHLLKGQNPTFAILCYKKSKKEFYINIVLSREIRVSKKRNQPIGIDLGIKNIVTTSNGLKFSGKQAQEIRRRYQKLRSSLQAKGTKSAKRTLKRLSGKERRWMKDLNHLISRIIVESIQTGEYIVMEKLKGIRTKRIRKKQRYSLHSWAFRQFQFFTEYKALELGIPVNYINPRNTSKRCSRCGKIGKRLGSLLFSCPCGYKNHADFNASYNIASRGHAPDAGLPSTSPEVASAEAKGSLEQLRPRIATS